MQHRTITATGHGIVRVDADAAHVRVAAVARSASVADALAESDAAIRLAGTIARQHAEASGISSTGLTVWPRHDREGRSDGFEARHSLEIRCPDLPAAAALVGALAEQVGERLVVDDVSLVVGDRTAPEGQAREAAYADARRRAEHLARLAGERLGLVVSATEGAPAFRGALPVSAAAHGSSDLVFEGGGQAVSTRVDVTWAVED